MNQPTPLPTFTQEMLDLQQAYLKRLGGSLTELRRFQELFVAQHASAADVQQLYRLSHNFAGSGATFGFADISRMARAFHDALDGYTNSENQSEGGPAFALVVTTLAEFIEICRNSITKKPTELLVANAPANAVATDRTVAIYSEGADIAPLLAALHYAGYESAIYDDPTALPTGAYATLLVSDLSKRSLDKFAETKLVPPVILLASSDDFDTRLAATRLGVQAYFIRDGDMAAVITRMRQLALPAATEPYHVLLVDDDPMLCEFYTHALKAAGMDVGVASNPKQAFKLLADTRFDLALLDVSLPQCSGPELAALIRLESKHADLPVIFMSNRETIDALQNKPAADDFLVKPFTPERLVSLAMQRARQYRALIAQ